jgi:hypothetical protein
VDGDQRDDVLIGSIDRLDAFSGARQDSAPLWSLRGDSPGDFEGAVAIAVDLNGDGLKEVVVGAPFASPSGGQPQSGAVYVYSGRAQSSQGFSRLFAVRGPAAGSRFGFSIAAIADVNGDGVAEIVVGAPGVADRSNRDAGKVWILSGRDGATLRTISAENLGSAQLGSAVAAIGDVDDDGFPDVTVGAPGYSPPGRPNSGAVFTFSGRSGCPLVYTPSGPEGCPTVITFSGRNGSPLDARLEGTEADLRLGATLASAGDLDGDGRPELLIGAPGRAVGGKRRAGTVFVRTTAPFASTLFRIEGDAAGDELGSAIAGGGDVNGDGIPDIVVGAPRAQIEGQPDAGYVRVYSGRDGAPLLNFVGAAGSRMGSAVAFCGDVNGDGRAEIAVGAPGFDFPAAPPFFAGVPGVGAALVLSLPKP